MKKGISMDKEEMISRLREITEIVSSVEDRYKDICFKALLENYLSGNSSSRFDQSDPSRIEVKKSAIENSNSQFELKDSNLHVKIKGLIKKYSLTLEELNRVFYLEKDDILPLFDSFGYTKLAETQIAIGLIQAFTNGIHTGDLEFDGEDVRAECQKRKAYDSTNFTANFKSNSMLFDGFSKYEKGKKIRLSEAGKQKMIEILKNLAK